MGSPWTEAQIAYAECQSELLSDRVNAAVDAALAAAPPLAPAGAGDALETLRLLALHDKAQGVSQDADRWLARIASTLRGDLDTSNEDDA